MNESELPQEAPKLDNLYQSVEKEMERLKSALVTQNRQINDLIKENATLKNQLFGHLKSKPENY